MEFIDNGASCNTSLLSKMTFFRAKLSIENKNVVKINQYAWYEFHILKDCLKISKESGLDSI
jgi:hypothetical protein